MKRVDWLAYLHRYTLCETGETFEEVEDAEEQTTPTYLPLYKLSWSTFVKDAAVEEVKAVTEVVVNMFIPDPTSASKGEFPERDVDVEGTLVVEHDVEGILAVEQEEDIERV